jgi:hypothetical protein
MINITDLKNTLKQKAHICNKAFLPAKKNNAVGWVAQSV